MNLALTEEQQLIAETASDFMQEKSPVSRFRELRDSGDVVGYSKALWKEMAELGWAGIPFPEKNGGAEMGMAELITVLEAAGAVQAPEPFLSSVLLAGQLLDRMGSEEQKKAYLEPMIEGNTCLAVALQESGPRYNPAHVAARAERDGDGYRLNGTKAHVIDGHSADALIVSARTSGETAGEEGISLFIVAGDAAGVTRTRQQRVDHRSTAIVELSDVRVDAAARVGEEGAGLAALRDVVDLATVGLCAEMLGGMKEAFESALAHMKEREQFEVKIASFQALQHRAVRLFIEIEMCRSSVMAAARALDEDAANKAQLVSLAKARCSDAYVEVANESIQFFGGVGVTDEYDVGFYLKRARVAELTFGDGNFHRDRWATLRGY
ncbi:MAG: acyl-CoA dehydrogenase family protein [Myxococcota bacterium]|jgi:alkylation response protein AidB-like acyl-CoA dehydrogenase|nr:acyl-CoA dehydrogenase family protein [Myxococcota bacterium]